MSVSIVTPAIPSRLEMLSEAIATVHAQTVPPIEHLIAIDYERIGVIANTNRLVEMARGDWVVPLADDDLLHPNFLEALLSASDGADVVYSEMTVEGETWPAVGPGPSTGKPAGLPGMALIRKALWMDLGGYRLTRQPEDLDLWQRMSIAGAAFRYVPEVLWTYRFHGGNASRNNEVSS